MTTSQSFITHLKAATSLLSEIANGSSDFGVFVKKAVDVLVASWPAISSPSILMDAKLDQSTLAEQSLRDTTSGKFAQLVIKGGFGHVVVEVPVVDEALWEPLQLWAEIVQQVWQANRQGDLHHQLHLYRGLSLVAQRVSSELASERVLEEACKSIVDVMNAIDHVMLTIHDNAPVSGTVYAEYPDYGNRNLSIPLNEYPVYDSMRGSREPLVVHRLDDAQELLGPQFRTFEQIGVQSALLLPLVVQNNLIGSVTLNAVQSPHQFTSLEIEVLQIVATQIAIGIHNAELFEEVSSRIVSEALTSRVTERLPLRADFNTLMQTAARELGQVLGAESAHIYLNESYLSPDQTSANPTTRDDG